MKEKTTAIDLGNEYNESVAFAEYLELLKAQGKVRLYSHIPNETYTTSWNQKLKNKRMGVSKGFPDYVILTEDELVVIEMKRRRGGVTSKEQKAWIDEFQRLGIRAGVCEGFDQAIEFLGL